MIADALTKCSWTRQPSPWTSAARAATALAFAAFAMLPAGPTAALVLNETPVLQADVAAGKLPAIGERLPRTPQIVDLGGAGREAGRHGGTLELIMGSAKDTRMMVVYGYARLVRYDESFELVPDLVESFDVSEGRIFTFKLRQGHRWSDGQPFTAEDFRYYWEDMALDPVISPDGPPQTFFVDGEQAKFEVLDDRTVRYSWSKPNPFFLTEIAAASPLYVYRPAHYLKQFHGKYADPAKLDALVASASKRDWRALHYSMDRQYKNDNPELPTLDPWVLTTTPPADRFVFRRNPFYHCVDSAGNQLPYIDRVALTITSGGLIPAKVGAGEADLQARGIEFKNYTVLKQGEGRGNYDVHLWRTGVGSELALYPNLNVADPVWRQLNRDVRFRRALSVAIDREEINQVVYFGLGSPAANTVLPESPLFDESYHLAATEFDLDAANALLDEIGLTERDSEGFRKLPDGRRLEIIVETAAENSDESDILQLIAESWQKAGIKLFTKPTTREVLRRRVIAGETVMSVFKGLDSGLATATTSPSEFVPTNDSQLQWPKWGFHHLSRGKGGEAPDMEAGKRLTELYDSWSSSKTNAEKQEVWQEILQITADNIFTIGTVCCVPQPVVVRRTLRNVPDKGLYNWDPGAHFGIYRPDTFWFAKN